MKKLLKSLVQLIGALSFIACLVFLAGAALALVVSVLDVLGVLNGTREFMAVGAFFLVAVFFLFLSWVCSWVRDRLAEKIEAEPGEAKGSGCLVWVVLVIVVIVVIVLIMAFFSPPLVNPVSMP